MKTIYLSGDVGWEITPDLIRNQIDFQSKERLRIIINSYGGYVSDGFEIYNLLKSYKGEIEIVIGVMAASIASYIAMVAPLERRKGFKNSSFMMHEVVGAIQGRARDFKIYSERLEGLNNIVAESYEGLGLSKEQAREKMDTDFYMTGWEALVENNVISDVIDLEEIDIPKKEEDEETFIIFELMMAQLKKPADISSMKAKVYEIDDKIKTDTERSIIDMQKAVAYLKTESNAGISADDKNLIMEEVNMTLQEFLKSNPEAQAEHEVLLQSAREQERTKMTAALSDDRNRVAKILELEGIKLSDSAVEALKGDMKVDTYMEARIKEQNALREKTEVKSPFDALKVNQTPKEQDPEGAKAAEAEAEGLSMEEYDKKLEETIKNRRVIQ